MKSCMVNQYEKLARDELYVSIRKLLDMANKKIVGKCMFLAIWTIVGNSLFDSLWVKPRTAKKHDRLLLAQRKAYERVPIGELLKDGKID